VHLKWQEYLTFTGKLLFVQECRSMGGHSVRWVHCVWSVFRSWLPMMLRVVTSCQFTSYQQHQLHRRQLMCPSLLSACRHCSLLRRHLNQCNQRTEMLCSHQLYSRSAASVYH